MKRRDCSATAVARINILCWSFLLAFGWYDTAAAGEAGKWITGSQLPVHLGKPVNVGWSGNPLGKGLRNLCGAHRVAVLIDRRVDPDQELELQLNDVPLTTVFEEVSRGRRLGFSVLGSVVYIGPAEASSRLRTLAALRVEEIGRLPPATAARFRRLERIRWDDLATPRELLQQLAERNGLELTGPDRIPHDLWAGADLPPSSLVDRLTLITVQFGLTFQVSQNGRGLTLVPIPERVGLVRSYPGGRQPEQTAERFATITPDAQIKVVGDKVFVKGLVEEHQRLSSPRQPPRQAAAPAAATPDTTRVNRVFFRDVPVRKVLDKMAEQLKLELRIDGAALRRAGISLDKLISVTVENVTVDELLRKVTQPARLKFRRTGNVVEIGPAE